MEKLIELFNEYEGPELEHTIIDGNVKRRVKNIVDPDKPYKWCSVRWYSKSFGFIKRLVDNDKIDFSWEGKLSSDLVDLFERKIDNAEGVIALLSISDTPIEDLISYLK